MLPLPDIMPFSFVQRTASSAKGDILPLSLKVSDEEGVLADFLYTAYRYASVAICSRVTAASGEKVLSEVPFTIPFLLAQQTAEVYHASEETSSKSSPVHSGEPSRR